MLTIQASSGDMVADRRAQWAEALLAEGDAPGAAALMRGAVEMAPHWAAGWFRLGEMEEAAARPAEAAACYERALALDRADPFGAVLRRDLLRAVPVVEAMPPAFVAALFDAYAQEFDAALRDGLNYRGPEALRDAVLRTGRSRFASALDLGCGTGLAGAALAPFCESLDGVDLSEGMLALARERGIYRRLERADITALPVPAQAVDLIVAADVFNYVGALEAVIAWCAGALAPGGLLAFTVETGAGAGPVTLRETRRFAHAPAYVAETLKAAGLTALSLEPATLRLDAGAPVQSLIALAAAPARDREGDTGALVATA